MSRSDAAQSILWYFADLLSYPTADLAQLSRGAQALANACDSGAADALERFGSLVEVAPVGRLEEIYTETFDLDPVCHLYIGAHLFGESYKRSAFLLKLKEYYKRAGLAESAELPDHLALVLRFLALCPDIDFASELAREAVLPALAKMADGSARSGSEDSAQSTDGEKGATADDNRSPRPYRYVIQALGQILQRLYPEAGESATREQQR